jgi:hypothetical protein
MHVEPVGGVRIRRRSLATAAAALLILGCNALAPAVIARDRHDDGHWVGTWSASPQAVAAPVQINGQTVRQIVHTSLGGKRVRVGVGIIHPDSTENPAHLLSLS